MIAKYLIGKSVARALTLVSVAGASLLVLATPNVDRLTSTSAIGPDVDVNRWTIDGGGVMFGEGSPFELSGTIGQHDAGTLLGGDYELNGGFWFPLTVGDCEDDGDVDLYDHARFADCITGPIQTPAISESCRCVDINQSQTVDLLDYATLQAAFVGSSH